MEPQTILLVVGIILIIIGFKVAASRMRADKIRKKYAHDLELAERIINKQTWEGQTSEQLIDALGRPSKIDEQKLKTKMKHTYKYVGDGKGAYKLHIYLENGKVSGWKKR